MTAEKAGVTVAMTGATVLVAAETTGDTVAMTGASLTVTAETRGHRGSDRGHRSW